MTTCAGSLPPTGGPRRDRGADGRDCPAPSGKPPGSLASDFPHEVVRSRFLKLDCSHIEFVMECLRNNTTEIRNMKQYLLAVLFNAPRRTGIYNQPAVRQSAG